MIKTAAQYWASHSAHGLRRSQAGSALSSLGQNGRGGLLPTAPGTGAGERALMRGHRARRGAVALPAGSPVAEVENVGWGKHRR
jgi:hypothetical protein